MNFSWPFIRRPIGTTLLAIGLFLVGAAAYGLLPVASLPSVDFPIIFISASRPGADPNTMAATVAAPLERQLGDDCRRQRIDLGELDRQFAHRRAVRSVAQHRGRRARRAGRAQRRAQRPADRHADAADLPQGQPGGGADPDPGAHLQDHAGQRNLRRRRQRDRAALEPGRRRRRRQRGRLRAAGASACASIRRGSPPWACRWRTCARPSPIPTPSGRSAPSTATSARSRSASTISCARPTNTIRSWSRP